MSTCTRKGCGRAAEVMRRTEDGHVWAWLCRDHDAEIEKVWNAEDESEGIDILRAWAMAQGGVEALRKKL